MELAISVWFRSLVDSAVGIPKKSPCSSRCWGSIHAAFFIRFEGSQGRVMQLCVNNSMEMDESIGGHSRQQMRYACVAPPGVPPPSLRSPGAPAAPAGSGPQPPPPSAPLPAFECWLEGKAVRDGWMDPPVTTAIHYSIGC